MKHTELGNTGISIPSIIFGTSALGNLYKALDYNTKQQIVKECLTHVSKPVVFDSAGKYGAGLALEMLGKILQDLEIMPDDVIISNKLGWLRTPLSGAEPTFEKGVWADLKNDALQNISFHGMLECWEQGNALLGNNFQPQLVSVHDPDEYLAQARNESEFQHLFDDITEAYKALSVLKSQGQVKAIGIGAKSWKVIRQIAAEVELDWVMFANSLTLYNHPKDLLEFMEELRIKGIGIINSAVFHAGFLTGGDFFDYVKIRPDSAGNKAKFEWRNSFFSVCKKFNVTPAAACVQFAMTPPGVLSISLNTSLPGRVKENVELIEQKIPHGFWEEMIRAGLIDKDYPHICNVLT